MDFTKTPQQDAAQAYEILARLYVQYCEPRDTVEGISTMMRSGLDIDGLQSILLETGTHIFAKREAAEKKYLEEAKEAAQTQRSLENNETILGLTPAHKGTLKKKYTLMEISSMHKQSLSRCKATFERIDNDCQDFEMACLSLPETAHKSERILFLDGHYDPEDDQKSERYIGQIIMTVLHSNSPYIEKTMQDAVDIKMAQTALGIE